MSDRFIEVKQSYLEELQTEISSLKCLCNKYLDIIEKNNKNTEILLDAFRVYIKIMEKR